LVKITLIEKRFGLVEVLGVKPFGLGFLSSLLASFDLRGRVAIAGFFF